MRSLVLSTDNLGTLWCILHDIILVFLEIGPLCILLRCILVACVSVLCVPQITASSMELFLTAASACIVVRCPFREEHLVTCQIFFSYVPSLQRCPVPSPMDKTEWTFGLSSCEAEYSISNVISYGQYNIPMASQARHPVLSCPAPPPVDRTEIVIFQLLIKIEHESLVQWKVFESTFRIL